MKLEWNTGGWFGSQIGGSCWILVAAILSASRDVAMGLVLLTIFLIPNVVGYVLWRRRTLSCYAAIQWLIALTGVSGVLAIYVLDRGRMWYEIQIGGSISAAAAYGVLVLATAGLMSMLYFRFGRDTDGPTT